ncbi:hypothetical protein N7468_009808 [Penicillium chermesinum]|uniref:Rhodopsin domain-containing protein n=1 Tax=Penicillium chermesinum TaxID=63820 RepID=A0A9W9TCQ9_9EURO|nr:uncharacterized protein N7468_009808 [Penicillium chermesinum]KAJ5216800.1 hypothetical protein N7468_009808 [Penicillium chermesinum]KAJ6171581.1 hypothetical protein N7470_000648 [Penicillium chermesinum]
MFETLQPVAYAVSFIFWALSTLLTCLRFYSRGWIIHAFGKDDWWMVLVLVFNTAQQGLFCAFLYYGGGLHLPPTPDPAKVILLSKLLFAEEISYIWMQFIIKTAFLLFYLRLTSSTTFIKGCMPLAAFWDLPAHPNAKCLPKSVTYYVPVSLCIMMDVIVLAFPIRPLWNIQASLSRRLGIIATITAGGIAVVVSCLRIIVLHQFAVNPDFTYILGDMVIISAIELNVAIMVANAPSLKAFWLRHVRGSLSDYTSSVKLSSLRKERSSNQAERSNIYQRDERGLKPTDLMDSSSTNNLVTRPGSEG